MLVLVDGVPGAGKSSTARLLRDALEAHRQPVRWWYEEEAGHPVYCFRDLAELQQVSDDLAAGRWQQLIDLALAQWQRFADASVAPDQTIILDGCLFGYLTWSLFAAGAPEAQIARYVADVARIIAPCQPHLIHLRPAAPADSLRRVFAARGPDWTDRFIERTTSRPYAQERNLRGFDGAVQYWEAYEAFADRLFADLALPKLAATTGGDSWPAAIRNILSFVGASPLEPEIGPSDLGSLQGLYADPDGDTSRQCQIALEADGLVAYDLPGLWSRNRLAPTSPQTFSVESLPHRVTFSNDLAGQPQSMTLDGPDFIYGPAGTPRTFRRVSNHKGPSPGTTP